MADDWGKNDKPATTAAPTVTDDWGSGDMPADPSIPRSIADSAIALGSGVTSGLELLSNVAGANNAVSRGFKGATDYLTNLESPYRKAEKQARAQKIRDAENSGSTWEEVKANLGAFAEAPIDTTLNALGTSAPTLAAGFIPGLGQAAVGGRIAQIGLGAAQGIGSVKGAIYDAVGDKLQQAQGLSPDEASKRADDAQAYSSDNLPSIALGGALGAVAGSTGAESSVRRIAGNEVAKQAAERSILKSAAKGVLHEAPLEAAQGGQERLSSNLALQKEGVDMPAFQGVAGQAALEGVASVPIGGAFGALEGLHEPGAGAVPPSTGNPTGQPTGPTGGLPLPPAPAAPAGPSAVAPAPSAGADSPSVPVSQPENFVAPADVLAQAEERRRTILDRVNGAPAKVIEGPDGQPFEVPARPKQVLTNAERGELLAIEQAGGDPAKLAQFYGLKLAPVDPPAATVPPVPTAAPVATAPVVPVNPVRDQVQKAADEGGTLSAAALLAGETGAAPTMSPVLDIATASPDEQAAYDAFFAPRGDDTDAALDRVLLDDALVPELGGQSNVDEATFLKSLGFTDQELNNANPTADQPGGAPAPAASLADAAANVPGATGQNPGQVPGAAGPLNVGPTSGPATEVSGLGGQRGVDAAGGPGNADAVGVSAGRGEPLAVPRPGAGPAADAAGRTGGPADGNPALTAPTSTKDAIAQIRAQKQEAADAQAAQQTAPAATPAVPAAGPTGVEADGLSSAGPAADIRTITAKQIPDMTSAELDAAIAHYGPDHPRTAKLQKAKERLVAQADTTTKENANGPQADQAQQAEAQRPQAPAPAAVAAPAADAPDARWTRMATADRQALVERTDLKPVVKKNIVNKAYGDLNPEIQRKLAAAMDAPAAAAKSATPRAMTNEGRAADGQPINGGDVFSTASGRVTTPYPKQKGERFASQWLIDNAVAEAQARGDDFNVTSFRAEAVGKGGSLPPASVASMQEYLFGQQPPVVPSILKPLVSKEPAGLVGPEASKADAGKEPEPSNAPASETKPKDETKKLQNTGADLRRFWEQFKKDLEAAKSTGEKAWSAVDSQTQRAKVFSPVPGDGATLGVQRFYDEVRGTLLTFRDVLVRDEPLGHRYYSESASEYAARRVNGDSQGGTTMGKLVDAATQYGEQMLKLSEHLSGATTVEQASEKLNELILNSESYWKPANLTDKAKELGIIDTGSDGTVLQNRGGDYKGLMPDGSATKRIAAAQTQERDPQDKIRMVRTRVDNIQRDMPKPVRDSDVDAAKAKDKFGFADVGFGNWVAKGRDQMHMNASFDAFADLANFLGLDHKAMGFFGKMHFTIGALGHGKYAAHFSPNQPSPNGGTVPVINVTNTRGDGTVAHEWGHALDWLAMRNDPVGKRVMAKVLQVLTSQFTMAQGEAAILDGLKGKSWMTNFGVNGSKGSVQNVQALVHYRLYRDRQQTQFKKDADALGKAYWGTPHEMFARAFEAYVYDSLGGTNNYLVNEWVSDGRVTQDAGYKGTPYPVGEERKLMNQAMAAMVKSMAVKDGAITFDMDKFTAALPEQVRDYDKLAEALVKSVAERKKQFDAEQAQKADDRRNAQAAQEVAQAAEAQAAIEAELRLREQQQADQLAALERAKQTGNTSSAVSPNVPLSDDDLSSLFDEALANVEARNAERPGIRSALPQQPEPGLPRRTSPAAADPKPPTANELIAKAAKLGVTGIDESLTALSKLFGGKGTLRSGLGFDEETYAQAKPHFERAMAKYQEAGRTLLELFELLIEQFGAGVRPYLLRFTKDNKLTLDLGNTQPKESPNVYTDTNPASDDRATDSGQGAAELRGPDGIGATADGSGSPGQGVDNDLRGVAGAEPSPGQRDGAEQLPAEGGADRGAQPEPLGAGNGAGAGAAARGSDYRLTDADFKREGSWRQTAERNLDLIALSKRIEAEGRPATQEEQAQLAKYTGWGASELAQNIFPVTPGYISKADHPVIYPPHAKSEYQALATRAEKELTVAELQEAAASTQFAHYTQAGIVRGMWGAIERLGFKGGKMFEAGLGNGLFPMLMPDALRENTRYLGIEKDILTARIAKLLLPQQVVRNEDFTRSKIPMGYFDAIVGNPPFADIKITNDSAYKKHRFLLHDYFLAKQMDALRPGGVMSVVVSAGTMDKLDAKAREYLAERADLLGAIRLPNNAFQQNAGTAVVTDVLFFQKREVGTEPGGQAWTKTDFIEVTTTPKRGSVMEIKLGDRWGNEWVGPGREVVTRYPVNEYFIANPSMVLGQHSAMGTQYGPNQYTVDPKAGDLVEQFTKAAENLPQGVFRDAVKPAEKERAAALERDLSPAVKKEGAVYVDDKGDVRLVENGSGVDVRELSRKVYDRELTDKDLEWLRSYTGIKAALKEARHAQWSDAPDWQDKLADLRKAYDAHVAKHGAIGAFRVQTRTSKTKVNEDGSPEVSQFRVYTNNALLRLDVEESLVLALESESDGKMVPGQALTERTIRKTTRPVIKSTSDALGVSLDELGRLDVAHVAELIGKSQQEVIGDLGDGVYEAAPGEWVMSDDYLSGDVVTKLEQASAMAATEPDRFNRNVAALLKVQPRPLGPADISVSLGAGWVPQGYVDEFASEVLGVSAKINYNDAAGLWVVDESGGRGARRSAVSDWSVSGKRSASEILADVLNSRTIKVMTPRTKDTPATTDVQATEAANDLAKKMAERFKGWVWGERSRALDLLEIYNSRFNRLAPRRFIGDFLTMPGITEKVVPFPHQKSIVWRAIQTGNVYAAHAVGAGKTMEMIMAGMEQKRLGLIKKPMYVVPNHMLEQFANEFQQLYPAAEIMVASDEKFHTKNRRRFTGQAAVNAPDAVIITHSGFSKIGLSAKEQNAVIQDFIDELDEAIQADPDKRSITRKKLEAQKERLEKRILSVNEAGGKDANVTFEDLGVDYLFVDEAHEFRKLDFSTNRGNVKGIDPNGSQKALDLYMKTLYLERMNPGRSHFFASGTPITNTIGELYSVMRFFMLDQMREEGVAAFDAWAKQYGEVKADGERNAAGNFEIVERFSKIVNVPELMKRFRTFADVITSDQLGNLVKRPDLKGGAPSMVEIQPSPALKAYMAGELSQRIERSKNWKPSKEEPNNPDPIINIITDGSLSTLDDRFFEPGQVPTSKGKIDQMVDNIIEDAKRFAGDVFKGKDGKPMPIKGGTQIVFSPIGLGEGVAKRGFDAYEYINRRLTEGGLKRAEIAWMRDLDSDAKKEQAFAGMRDGKIKVLIGSPKNMGTGVNVQLRLKKLHFLAPPWFPSDVEQPHGRILRQGNQNSEVEIDWYVRVGTYDAAKWGMVARKDRFIKQALSGDDSIRTMEDISEESQYAQAAAIASGDQRQIDLVRLEGDVQRLQRLKGAYADKVARYRSDLSSKKGDLKYTLAAAQIAKAVLPNVAADPKTATITIGKKTFNDTADAGPALLAAINAMGETEYAVLGEIKGIGTLTVQWNKSFMSGVSHNVNVRLVYEGSSDRVQVRDDLVDGPSSDGQTIELPEGGLAQRLVNVQKRVASKVQALEGRADSLTNDIATLEVESAKPFPEQEKLSEAQEKFNALQQELLAEGAKATASAKAETEQASQAGSGPVTFSQGLLPQNSGPKPTLEQVQRLVDQIQQVSKNVIPVTVVASPSQVAGLEFPVGTKPSGALVNGRIYLFSDNLGSAGDAYVTLFHEIFHLGLQKVIPAEDYAAVLKSFASNVLVQRYMRQWKNSTEGRQRAAVMPSAAYEALATEEALAMVSEELASNNGVGTNQLPALAKKMLSWLASVAERLGFPPKFGDWVRGLTRTDAEKFVSDMTRAVLGGQLNLSATRAKYGTKPDSLSTVNRLSGGSAEAGGEVKFRTAGEAMKDYAGKAVDQLNLTIGAPGKLNWWHKSLGTMYNLAERNADFKRVFDSAQGFIEDVSYYANDAAELAPKLLPKLENWRDIRKSPISAADNTAIAKPIFEGTLEWARGEDGKPVRLSALEAAAEKLDAGQKAQRMLRADKISEGVLKMWQGLPIEQYEKLIESRYQSQVLKAGIVWTPAELKSMFKLSDAQVALYQEFRQATDRSLDTMSRADMLRFGGEDVKPLAGMVMDAADAQEAAVLLRDHLLEMAQAEPDRSAQLAATANGMIDRADKVKALMAEGYAPLSRFGKYTVDVVVDGERQYFGLYESKREANIAALKFRQEFGRDNVVQGTLSDESFKLFAGITPESLELFGNMLGLDSTGDTAQDAAFQEYLRLTKTNRSAMRRLIHRQGIAGYSEDVGRVLASFIYSNSRQTAAGLHMGELGEAVNAIPKQHGEMKDAAIQLSEYIKNPQEEAQAIRGLLFAQYLGGSIASAVVNMTQPVAVSFPWLSQFGGAKNAAVELGRAAKNLASRNHRYEADLAQALKHAEEDGTVSPQEVHQLMAQARGAGGLRSGDGTRAGDLLAAGQNGLSRLSLAWGKVFGVAEQANRRMTFIAAYRIAKAQGMANPSAFAKKAVTETQFVYSKANKMKWGRGAVGGTLMTFKTYSIAYLELMNRMWTQGGPEGKRAVLLALGTMLLMSGAAGLPFAEDAEDLIDGIAQIAGYNFNTKKAKQEFLENLFGRGMADFIDRGITGLPGSPLDVSGRLGMGNLIPGTGLFKEKKEHTSDVLELVGPVGDLAKRAGAGVQSILRGDVGEGLLSAAPNAVRNFAKGVDMGASGAYKDDRGYKVIGTTPVEAAFKAIGFQPATVAKVQQANYINQQAKNFYSLNSQAISAKWAAGIAEKKPELVAEARADIQEWNRKNPDQKIVINMAGVLKRAKEMAKDKDQRIADTAPKAMRQALKEEVKQARLER